MGRCGRRVDGTESDATVRQQPRGGPAGRTATASADVGAARARRPQVDPFQPQILQPSPRLLQKPGTTCRRRRL